MKMAIIRNYTFLILLILHLVGIGLFAYLQYAPEISYVTILLSAVLVFLNEPKSNKSILIFITIFLAGYVIELIGVQTGLLFGNYSYESAMGPLFMETPIVIGATWYAVVVGAANIARRIKGSTFGRSIIAGLMAVGLDFFIEKVAVAYGFWSWELGVIPLFNYVCWFIFSALFAFLYLHFQKNENAAAIKLFVVWLLFFGLLILLKV